MVATENPIRFTLIVYAPLSFPAIPNQLHDMPVGKYWKCLPKFAGNNAVFVDDHLIAFLNFVDDLEVEYGDVVINLFAQTLEGVART